MSCSNQQLSTEWMPKKSIKMTFISGSMHSLPVSFLCTAIKHHITSFLVSYIIVYIALIFCMGKRETLTTGGRRELSGIKGILVVYGTF